jgi:hypothetical protein
LPNATQTPEQIYEFLCQHGISKTMLFLFITHYFLTLFIMAFCDFNELNNENGEQEDASTFVFFAVMLAMHFS